jgi:enoyl-CoA hydratase
MSGCYTAEQALRWGLVTEVHEPDALLAAALAKAQRIATRAPLSVEAAESAITQAFELDFEQGQALQTTKFIEMFRTEDHQEALRAFFEKREGTYVRR